MCSNYLNMMPFNEIIASIIILRLYKIEEKYVWRCVISIYMNLLLFAKQILFKNFNLFL